jgi:hypothetical protein
MALPEMTRHLILMAVLATASISFEAGAFAKQRSAEDKALLKKATAECNGNHYPGGARPVVNYKRGTFRCEESKGSRR